MWLLRESFLREAFVSMPCEKLEPEEVQIPGLFGLEGVIWYHLPEVVK